MDERGRVALPGFFLEDMEPVYGDRLDGVMSWATGANVSALQGKPIRIRMRLRDADVFALRFA